MSLQSVSISFQDNLPGEDVDGKALLLLMQLASLVARIIFGKVADVGWLKTNRVFLQQVN